MSLFLKRLTGKLVTPALQEPWSMLVSMRENSVFLIQGLFSIYVYH